MTFEEPPLAQYRGDESFFGGDAPLPLSAGYAIVLGFGAFFMLFTTLLVWIDQKYNKTKITSEQFNTAGRSVPIGLTASVIVSQWTWAATLLQSSNVAFAFGVSGPFWYASGATIQVLLFGILAIELKRKAPTCHTVCEMVNVRWGKTAHITFLIFCFMANVIVTSMLLLGGAATVNALTGMNIALASFFIPWGVILYTMAGGLKATFMASYVHTAIIFLILVTFVFTVYVKEFSSDIIYDWLDRTVSYSTSECEAIFSDKDGVSFFLDKDGKNSEGYACGKVADNNGGSYLTMLSWGGLQFGIINIVGNFGTVFVDQSYWQSAIAAKPSAAHKGYLLGGLCWFTIPFTLATSMGLSALALQLPITAGEAGAGLVPPAVAVHLFGNLGGYMIAIMLFMAIVSTGSAESIAVSSLCAYDIYRQYINPAAEGKDILWVSRITILAWGLGMGVFSIILHEIGLNLGWVYQFMGIAIGSAVYPLWSLLTNTRTSATGAVAGAWGGMVLAFVCWIATCAAQNDEITVSTLASKQAFLVGNIVALAASALICEVASVISPQNYDWALLDKGITMIEDDRSGLSAEDLDPEELLVAKKWIETRGWVMTIVLIIVWPILSIPAGVFTKSYFAFWIFVAVCWGFAATLVITVMPLYESRDSLYAITCGILGWEIPDKMDESRNGGDHKEFWKKEQPAKA
jgi:SSS family transporter